MGHSLGADARTTEFSAFLDYELDDAVYEFWEQAVELVIRYDDKSGRRRAVRTRIDALVLERDGVYLDSWKTEEELLELIQTKPGMYARGEKGWYSPASEVAAAEIGLRFRLRTPASIRSEVVQNGIFLRSYWRSEEEVTTDAAAALLEAVDERPGLTVADVLRSCPKVRVDDLYLLIARGDLYVDLARHKLADAFHTPVFRSKALALAVTGRLGPVGLVASETQALLAPGAQVEIGGRVLTVVASSELSVRFRAEGGGLIELGRPEAEQRIAAGDLAPLGSEERLRMAQQRLRTSSPKAMAEAERRTGIVRDYLAGDPVPVSRRTARRWAQRYREEVLASGLGLLALLPARAGRPAGRSLPPELEAIISKLIEERYEVPDPPTKDILHAEIVEAAKAAGLTEPSYSTVLERLRHRDRLVTVRRQQGRKAAYQVEDWIFYLAHDTPRHGDRPWERAHLDHTQIDLELADSETGLALGRPWLTLLIDAYSRRILAFWLTFDEPSAVSAVMVLRRCVQRWGRLPEELVVDDGAEFNSTWFERLLTARKISKLTRRGDPRAGNLIERLFGTLNTRLWHRLRGQTRPTKKVRSMSPEVDPERRAIWTLASITPVLEEFLFGLYDTTTHPAFGDTPRNVYAARMALTGERTDTLVAYDEAFFFMTLPSTRTGHAKVSYERGVKINGRHYLAAEFRVPGVAGTSVPVRWDPMDARHAYAFVSGRWVELYCPSLRRFPVVSTEQVAAISAEYDQRRRRSLASRGADAAALAAFQGDAKKAELVLLESRRDRAGQEAGHSNTPPPLSLVEPHWPSADEVEAKALDGPAPAARNRADRKRPAKSDKARRPAPDSLEVFGTY
jgi:TnsA endonuclease C terminal./Integrase core domain.